MATLPGPSDGPRPQARALDGADDTPQHATPPPVDHAAWSRRRFLTRASVAVAATAAASAGLASMPRVAEAAAPARTDDDAPVSEPGEDIVAHVRGTSTGELALFVGAREVVYRDPALVRRLVAGARCASRGA